MRDKLTQQRAAILRRNLTDAEHHLWQKLRRRQISAAKFRRQVPIGPYIADFVCITAKLVIELDGGQHHSQQNYDSARTVYLQQCGFHVLRFWNNEVLQNIDNVLTVIQGILDSACAGGTPPPCPPPQAGEGEKK